MAANYIVACEKFNTSYSKARPKIDFPFKDLDELCDVLFEIKEDHHLIFKRVVGPEKIKDEDKHKINPAQQEINFIANVGRLFHKMLVARELKYLHSHYDPLNNGDSDGASELEMQLKQIDNLFAEGVKVMVDLMQLHSANVLLLALLVENMNTMRRSIGIKGTDLLRKITGQNNPEATYFLTGKYYMEGGWYTRAEKLFRKILKTNPKHSAARVAMDEIKIAFAKQSHS
ncbi:MAG: hypothetical protein ACE5I1_02495 [bacterium]